MLSAIRAFHAFLLDIDANEVPSGSLGDNPCRPAPKKWIKNHVINSG